MAAGLAASSMAQPSLTAAMPTGGAMLGLKVIPPQDDVTGSRCVVIRCTSPIPSSEPSWCPKYVHSSFAPQFTHVIHTALC